MSSAPVIVAPANIGILGGGQLGAMLCEAGRRMGYVMHVLSESPEDPAARWADRHVTGETNDPATVAAFARTLDVLTNEFEQVPPEVLRAAEGLGTVRVAPSSGVQSVCRDRRHEKSLFAAHQFPHGPFAIVERAEEVEQGLTALPFVFGDQAAALQILGVNLDEFHVFIAMHDWVASAS